MPKPIKIDSNVVAAEAAINTERRLRAWQRGAQSGGRSMAKEPDNLVLKMLREIRGRLDKHEERFDKIDKKLDDMSESLTFALGISMQANVRHESVQKKLDALEQRVNRLEERV
jgi:polyhydroxyalkanoate synthesis regulator phasin